jgi:hypothetical protein
LWKVILKKAFGSVLKVVRLEKELIQQELADFTGMDRAYNFWAWARHPDAVPWNLLQIEQSIKN